MADSFFVHCVLLYYCFFLGCVRINGGTSWTWIYDVVEMKSEWHSKNMLNETFILKMRGFT
jgi:hypothetical protein